MITFTKPLAVSFMSSQNGEEGILQECLKRIPSLAKVCAEFGAYDGNSDSNTAWLIKVHGWNGTMIESDPDLFTQCLEYWKGSDLPNIPNCIMAKVTADNINEIIPPDCQILSIDTDGSEFETFKALKIKPAIVIVEVDSSLNPTDPNAINNSGGVGYLPMVKLGIEKGYFPISHVGNLVFVDDKYKPFFPEITADPITEYQQYFNRSWRGEGPD